MKTKYKLLFVSFLILSVFFVNAYEFTPKHLEFQEIQQDIMNEYRYERSLCETNQCLEDTRIKYANILKQARYDYWTK